MSQGYVQTLHVSKMHGVEKKKKIEHLSTGSGLLLVLRPGEVLANTRLINALHNYNVASLDGFASCMYLCLGFKHFMYSFAEYA